mmetsp:Transcript_21631/g.69942  ORF Transcript_21631/g.69942 Transcript_21631/m.69942 type:complete len:271 (+) Transcript_21631:286-1098(+)
MTRPKSLPMNPPSTAAGFASFVAFALSCIDGASITATPPARTVSGSGMKPYPVSATTAAAALNTISIGAGIAPSALKNAGGPSITKIPATRTQKAMKGLLAKPKAKGLASAAAKSGSCTYSSASTGTAATKPKKEPPPPPPPPPPPFGAATFFGATALSSNTTLPAPEPNTVLPLAPTPAPTTTGATNAGAAAGAGAGAGACAGADAGADAISMANSIFPVPGPKDAFPLPPTAAAATVSARREVDESLAARGAVRAPPQTAVLTARNIR